MQQPTSHLPAAPNLAPDAAPDAARLRILVVADECNPEWPSLPIVGYKYAREIAAGAEVTLVTHVRNRENIEKAGDGLRVDYIDTEWIAAPMYRIARLIRGGEDVGWSTAMISNYLPYLAFERAVWRRYRRDLQDGKFDIVHRITPMSPTLPSYLAGRSPVPFVIGPLNGNLPWPKAFSDEQKREKEGLRKLRNLYKRLPYARSTYARAACVLAAFDHTRADLGHARPDTVVPFPEIGFDPALFHDTGTLPAGRRGDGLTFLYAGRLVPYKLPELVLRAFAASDVLRQHRLRVIGDGPERARMEAIIAEEGLEDCVVMEGGKSQAEVAEAMRTSDVFVFPSIRELGAGVVIEAMASGMHCIVTGYGAPGALVGETRGVAVPLAQPGPLTDGFRAAMEAAVAGRDAVAKTAAVARDHAHAAYPWHIKGARTLALYRAVRAGAPLAPFGYEEG